MKTREKNVNDREEYKAGYGLGVDDCSAGRSPRFQQDHSEFAMGYIDGWTNHEIFLNNNSYFMEDDDLPY